MNNSTFYIKSNKSCYETASLCETPLNTPLDPSQLKADQAKQPHSKMASSKIFKDKNLILDEFLIKNNS